MMQWTSQIQRAITQEWVEGCQKATGPRALQILRKQIATKYGLSVYVIQGIIELGATQGLGRTRGEWHQGTKFEPINYHELVGDLKERVAALERKFSYLLEGIERVIEDGITMRAHVDQLRGMSKWMRRRDVIDFEDRPKLSASGEK